MSAGSSRADRLAWAGLALGGLLRLLHQVHAAGTPCGLVPRGNALGFLELAHGILRGDLLLGDQVLFYGPLYPYFLAPFLPLGDPATMLVVRAVQALLGLATAWLLWRIARRVSGPAAGAAAAWIYALYGPGLHFETLLVATTLSTFLLVLGLHELVRAVPERGAAPARRHLIAILVAGVALGLSAWGRGNVVLLLPVAAIWLLLARRGTEGGAWARWRPGLVATAWLTLAASAVILPVTARNAIVAGDRVLMVSQGGINFYAGNNQDSRGWFELPEEEGVVTDHAGAYEANTRAVAERNLGRELRPSEVDAYWFGLGARWLRENPREALALWGIKLRLLLHRFEIPNYNNAQVWLDGDPATRRLPRFDLLLLLALAGLPLVRWRGNAAAALFASIALAYAGSVVLFYVSDRYRFPLAALLTPFAAVALAHAVTLVTRRVADGTSRWRLVLAGLGAAAGLAIALAPSPSADFDEARNRWAALEHARRGACLEAAGDPAGALACYETGLARQSGHVNGRLGQARSLRALGRPAEAAEILEKLAPLVPTRREPRELLVRLYFEPPPLGLGEPERARPHLEALLRLDPSDSAARTRLESLGVPPSLQQ